MFDISIVVPVYNKEKYIADCIKSLVQQKTKKNIEIICINDGSKDNSLEVLKELQKLNSNLRIIDKKNGGVSSARNYGLKAATGRYVLFLDADDYLSENTVEDIVNFFDQNSNSIDLVTYNIYYERKGKSVKGKRGNAYKNNCIIDLNKEPDFSQTTMNVCVKNGLNIYFDENIELGEDQLFNTTILSKKKKIGWCNTAKYFYRRDASSTGLINHPYFAAESINYFFKRLIELGESEQFDSYCKSLILYNFSWRISGDYLFEYHLTEGKAVLSESLTEILNKIDSDLIIKNRWLIRDHKHFLLSLKSRNKPFVIKEEDGLYLCDSLHGEFANEKRITIVFQREKIHNNKLYLMGFLKSDCLNYCGKPELYVEENGQKGKISLYESSNSYFGSPIKTNKYWGFELNINIEKPTNIKFFAKIDDYFYPTGFWFRPWSAISTDNKVFIHEGEKFVIEVKGDTILCKPVSSKQKSVSKKIEAELKKE